MWKSQLQFLAIISFVAALILTALGGWSNMLGRPFILTERHAWNDGLFLMLVAIFFLVLSK